MNALTRVGGEPLTMSSLDISELTGKTHGHVKRDIEQMLSGLELDVSSFGRIYRDAMNRRQQEYLLPKDLTLTLVTGYDVKRRHAINKRWMELESGAALPAVIPVAMVEAFSDAVMRQVGGMMKAVVHKQLGEAMNAALPDMIHGVLAKQQTMIREGETAGQVWKRYGFRTKGMRGYASWFGNRLAETGCQIAGGGRASVGGIASRLFDPDRVALAMKAGLRDRCERYIVERLGQGVLL